MEKAVSAKTESAQVDTTPDEKTPARDDTELQFAEMAPWLELFCWSVLGWVPWLYWINGPAVTDDQAVVQMIMILAALAGGISLCIRAIRLRKKGALARGEDSDGMGSSPTGPNAGASP